MPVTFHSPGQLNSRPSSLQSDTLSTPPVSHQSFEDIPFKPQEDDHVSLSMRKRRSHRHKRENSKLRRTAAGVRRKTQPSGSRHRSRNLRKTHSLPSVQPRFDHGSVETLAPLGPPHQRVRRWTVPSKAASTRGLATLVPVDNPRSRADEDTRTAFHPDQSPAMITLRRATSSRSRRQTTLTSFPPPKFSRDRNGLLSSFLCSITGHDDTPSYIGRESESKKSNVQKTGKTSATNTRDELRLSTSAIAPPVQTEVIAVEPQLSVCGPNQTGSSIRRCSTRYISENTVYEIIWDENWTSSPSSEGGSHSSHGRGSILQSRELAGTDTLERRLSNALSRSRRPSVQDGTSRRTSYVPGVDASLQSIWANPKITRLFREPTSDRLPRSKAAKMNRAFPSPALDIAFPEDAPGDGPNHEAPGCVEFFPPLRSRANTDGRKHLEDMIAGAAEGILLKNGPWGPSGSRPDQVGLGPAPVRSRLGSMVGISSHAKRRSTSDHDQPRWGSMTVGGRRASEGLHKRAKSSDDETIPLLGTT